MYSTKCEEKASFAHPIISKHLFSSQSCNVHLYMRSFDTKKVSCSRIIPPKRAQTTSLFLTNQFFHSLP